ncbi:MAG TPA: thiol peroxidase [Polyangiaceae bacterium]|jgi:thiol peroxidase|nr:MAG: Thiol peroxidase [Deltaproteobacteria bacterium ADurb.Bin207]HNS98784.1 thiol peroxidase [Polyangiaceae bacterium]HNZ22987.1 thiol peroxidase [Polyangiaceae bacterium]HOD24361.1 thiol peroxidase [Polyangiaceae bacterium]HOE51811.1 thiol peroxidase [Polyangiaceae bacterium]
MSKVTFHGNPATLEGKFPSPGDKAPPFTLVNGKLENMDLTSFSGKKKVLTINPSYDTPVCAKAAREFNTRAATINDAVVLAISADLPFAQGRFCTAEGIEGVVPLSAFRSPTFAKDYGVLITDGPLAGLTARAVVVIDENDKVIYSELVGEIVNEPNYEAALASLR